MKIAKQLGFGCIAGGSIAAWYCLIEAICIYVGFPYQRDLSIWTSYLPMYVGAGMVVGITCVLFLFFVRRKRKPNEDFCVRLGVLTFSAIAALVVLIEAHLSMLALRLGWSPILTIGVLVPAGLLLYALLLFLSRTLLKRPLAFMCIPSTGIGSLVAIAVLAGVSWLLPIGSAELASQQHVSAPTSAPNVLFVVLDTVRPDHLGTYGYEHDTSPRLDAFAAQGVVFEKAFSTAPWTLPSHASMFTGLHATTHGTGWENPRLADGRNRINKLAVYDYHTLAEELSQRGYQTVGVADKHWLSYEIGLTQGFEQFHDYSIATLPERFLGSRLKKRIGEKLGPPVNETYPRNEDKGGAVVIETALEWLGGSRERDSERPFFMFMNLNEAHDPYLPPTDYWQRFLPEGVTVADTLPENLPARQLDMHEYVLGNLELSPATVEKYLALYDGEIAYQDMLLGRLFDGLDQMNLADNTLVIIVADHGEEFGEFESRIGHQLSNVDNLLHVPLILRYPPALPAGQRISSLASTVDIFPTILDLIERESDSEPLITPERLSLEGVSLFDTMQVDGAPARDMILAHYGNPTAYLSGWSLWGEHVTDPLSFPLAHYLRTIDVLRTEDEKFFSYSDGSRAFLELLEDPLELTSQTNSVTPQYQARASAFELRMRRQLGSYRTLHEMLVGHMVKSRVARTTDRSANNSSQQAEELGYVGSPSGDGTEATGMIVLPPFMRN